MTTQVTPTINFYAYLSSVWTDITDDQIGNYEVDGGMYGNKPTDRMAGTGTMSFTLNNATGKYLPSHTSALAGWDKGTKVKLEFTFDGQTKTKFIGWIDTIEPEPKGADTKFVNVVATDWFDYAAKYPLVNPTILTNKRADEALTALVPLVPIQPTATSYDTGVYTFPAVFNNVSKYTRAYTEISRLTQSEVGYSYLKSDGTLVFEGAHYRHGLRTLDQIPVPSESAGALLKEDGGYLLKEDGGKILLDETTDAVFDNTTNMKVIDFDVTYGEGQINRMTITAYPVKQAAALEVLFTLNEPLLIGDGQTITLRGSYANPSGGAPINATGTVTPVATTDYLANTLSDGTGTDKTADQTLVTAFGADGFTTTITNGYAGNVYLTKFSPRGYGLYKDNPIEIVEEDTVSEAAYGYQNERLDQIYQRDTTAGEIASKQFINDEKDPQTKLMGISLCANVNSSLMNAFLNLEIGSLVKVIDPQNEINGYFFIQGCPFTVQPGGIIMFTFLVKEYHNLTLGLSQISVDLNTVETIDAIDFGYLPYLSSPCMSQSYWIYTSVDTGFVNNYILNTLANATGWGVGIRQGMRAILWQWGESGDTGLWWTPENVITLNVWNHIVVTRDRSLPSNQPSIYVNGVSQAITETYGMTNPYYDTDGAHLLIGNCVFTGHSYTFPYTGKIMNVRIYNDILTSTEVTALYNAGRDDESTQTDHLIFQGLCVKTKDLTYFTDHTMLAGDGLIDNIYGVIGKAHGSPITRLP